MEKTFGEDLKLPGSRPERGGARALLFWALVSLLILGGLAFWFLSGPEKREELRELAAESVNELVSGTPLAGVGDILRESPPPLPPELLNPPTEKGTLSGRRVTGSIASPVDLDGNGAAYTGDNSSQADLAAHSGVPPQSGAAGEKPVFSDRPLPPATEDSRVKPGYLSELADWLSGRFRPGPGGGTLELSPQNLNNLWGVSLAGQMPGGRSGLLRYAFQPSMIEGLYKIYINQFMVDLNQAASKRGFSEKENRDFHQAVAGKAASYASAMSGILEVPDLSGQLANIDALGQKSVEENAQLAAAVFELDELRDKKASGTQISAAEMRIQGITARYRRAVESQERAQRALAAQIRKAAGPALDEASLLFMASWVQRRLEEDDMARQSLSASASIMRDLAQRCKIAASN